MADTHLGCMQPHNSPHALIDVGLLRLKQSVKEEVELDLPRWQKAFRCSHLYTVYSSG